MNIDSFFYEHPIFRLDELAAWKLNNTCNKSAIQAQVQYYLNKGRLLLIKRELYAVVPPNAIPQEVSVDPYLIAAKIAPDGILGFHTALELLGSAYSAFGQFTYLSTHKPKSLEFQEQWFQPVVIPTALKRTNNILFAVETINRQGIDICVTSSSRTFVDVLHRVKLSGGWEEVIRSIGNMSVLNIEHVIEYCMILDNAILSAKVGYFLEQRQGAFAPTEAQLNRLLQHKPSAPQYLSKKTTEPCKLIKKWNIMMPISIIEKHWEEPSYDI